MNNHCKSNHPKVYYSKVLWYSNNTAHNSSYNMEHLKEVTLLALLVELVHERVDVHSQYYMVG